MTITTSPGSPISYSLANGYFISTRLFDSPVALRCIWVPTHPGHVAPMCLIACSKVQIL